MSPVVIVAIWLLFGFGSAAIAMRQGKEPIGAFIGGLILPLGLVAIAWVLLSALGVVWMVAG